MAHRIVILGGGTGGTLAANRLRRLYGEAAKVVVVDRDDRHVYKPGLLHVPFGGAAGVLSSWDERRVPFDLLVTIPLHGGAPFVGRSPGLGDIITVGEFYERAAGAQIVFT